MAMSTSGAATEEEAVAQPAFEVQAVAEGLYLHTGSTVAFGHPRRDDIANVGFVVGQRCVAVIDSGGSVRNGDLLRQAIRNVTDRPICYVINTHVHPDKTLGNQAFVDDRPTYVGHYRLPNAFAHNQQFLLDNFAEELGQPATADKIVPPTLLVEDSVELDLGDRILRLHALPPGHTDQDLAVYDPATSTLWLGSLFVQHVPALDSSGSVSGWLENTKALQLIGATTVIPGNGPAPLPWPDAAADQQRYLETLIREVREVIQQGGFLEDAIARAGRSDESQWQLFDQHHGANVTRAFAELEWD
jgi:quinoprotein relay system zinc metallohydrolase 2